MTAVEDLTGVIVGKTEAASGYLPKPYYCWASIYQKYASIAELMQTGFVYEILEENRPHDRCYGIVESSTIETDQRAELALFREKPALRTRYVKLRIIRESGLDAPVDAGCKIKVAGPEAIRVAYNIPGEGVTIGLFTLPAGYPAKAPPVKLPYDYFLGKEAAHGNTGGQSGWGKTGLNLIICKSILSDEKTSKDTCIIAFNVKADDLLWVDKQNPELTEEDKKIYEAINLPCEPFQNVTIFAPEKASLNGEPNSLRQDARAWSWEWVDVKDQLAFGIAPEDWDYRLEALLSDLKAQDVREFREVVNLLDEWIEGASKRGAGGWYHGHHIATIRKAKRIIEKGFMETFKGLIGGTANPLPLKEQLKPSHFVVIDISRPSLTDSARRLIVGKVVSDARNYLEEGGVEVKRIVFLIDELNRFAPRDAKGPIAGIRAIIDRIASEGRGIGCILLGVEQYPSNISYNIIGNVSTKMYVRTKPTELDAAVYRGYSQAAKNFLSTNRRKGIALIDHDTFNDLVLVRFPRPPCAQKRRVR